MAGELPTRILRAISDLSESDIRELSDSAAWRLIYSLKPRTGSRQKDNRPQICFSGFSASERTSLEVYADEHGFHVAKSVTMNLSYLVAGDNCGPKKLESALAQEVTVLDKTEFLHLVATGEVPSNRVLEHSTS